jgi:tRNA modification GTPase
MRNETIAALSTPYGRGGIAVIRVSGENAQKIGDAVFRCKNGRPLSAQTAGKLVHGEILHEGNVIDDAMAVIFRAPHSFTGEDTVELHCHGGILLSQLVLESAFLAGAVPAQAGEFTQRAFLNGKIDLSQAEAVIDLIDAQSQAHLRLAASQAKGTLSRRVNALCDEIYTILCSTYAFIDFPDEDLTDIPLDDLKARLRALILSMQTLADTYHAGRAIAQGIPTVLFGRPNTGKSSLLNALLGQERAIVTDIAGTTRDTIEETAVIGKVQLRLCDTAGIRQADGVEGIGVRRAWDKLNEAELVLAVFDQAQPLQNEDKEILSTLEKTHKTVIAILNKSDLAPQIELDEIEKVATHTVTVSCKEATGLQELSQLVNDLFVQGEVDYNEAILSNARQYSALQKGLDAVKRALGVLEDDLTQDVCGMDLEEALGALRSLDGKAVGEEIVNGIFSRFCVGK